MTLAGKIQTKTSNFIDLYTNRLRDEFNSSEIYRSEYFYFPTISKKCTFKILFLLEEEFPGRQDPSRSLPGSSSRDFPSRRARSRICESCPAIERSSPPLPRLCQLKLQQLRLLARRSGPRLRRLARLPAPEFF